MAWIHHKLIYRLISPQHIEGPRTGNLQTARGYVHGKVMWDCLTSCLTRQGGRGVGGAAYVQ
ncbi:hypothetical protein [Desulfotomaculum copahuensis]|uniref:Uncharacterized protein n=1 Tax=Desulfotomaculum copahuensis TaxID=1838280 RepID=A0A1B7LDM5_9FIRM|nr:hypothetical protein [Desulfotomaculum copahuensis]OAT81209.1 hypothetical protein A6M21_11355 [Desulfotomaculum copahuensis]